MDDLETTNDAFLGGRITLKQPAKGYRAGTDPVYLAAAVPARPGESVLDLGTGVGTILFCLAARVERLTLTGVELDATTAEIARQNVVANDVDAAILTADISCLPDEVRAQSFDHVVSNPPYFEVRRGTGSTLPHRRAARHEVLSLSRWIDIGVRRVSPKGSLTVVQRIERLPDLLRALPAAMGSIRVHPFSAREDTKPDRFILTAQKGGRSAFRLMPATVLHCAEGYSEIAEAVLRHAKPWPWNNR